MKKFELRVMVMWSVVVLVVDVCHICCSRVGLLAAILG